MVIRPRGGMEKGGLSVSLQGLATIRRNDMSGLFFRHLRALYLYRCGRIAVASFANRGRRRVVVSEERKSTAISILLLSFVAVGAPAFLSRCTPRSGYRGSFAVRLLRHVGPCLEKLCWLFVTGSSNRTWTKSYIMQ